MKYLLAISVLCFLSSCDSKEVNEVTAPTASFENDKVYIPSYAVNNFEGTYSGSFDNGYIIIEINYVNGKNASGYNLHKGVRRNINGTLQPATNGFHFMLKEPGDNPFDGTFDFIIDTSKFALGGTWIPFDSSRTKSKTLALQKQPKKVTINYEDELGMWVPATGTYSTDTTLDFDPAGTCEYRFYSKPGDVTSQMNSVRGNYIQVKDTVLIEWQKNSFTPEQKMKMVKRKKILKDAGGDYTEQQLVGHGWKFAKFEGD